MKKLMTMIILFSSLSTFANDMIFKFDKYADQVTKDEIIKSLKILATDVNSRLAQGTSLFDVGYAGTVLSQSIDAIRNDKGLFINSSGCCGGYVQTKALPIYYGYKNFSYITGWLYYGVNTEINHNTGKSSTSVAFAYSHELNVKMFEDGHLKY